MAKDFLSTAAQVLQAPHKIKAQRDIAQTRAKSAMDVAQMKEGGLWGRAKMVDQTKREIADMQYQQHMQKMIFDADYRNAQLEQDERHFGANYAMQKNNFLLNSAKFEQDAQQFGVTEEERATHNRIMEEYARVDREIQMKGLEMRGARIKMEAGEKDRRYAFDVEKEGVRRGEWEEGHELAEKKNWREQQKFPVEMADLQARGYLHGRQAANYDTEQQAKLENIQSQISQRGLNHNMAVAQYELDKVRVGLIKQSQDQRQLQSNLKYNMTNLLRIDLARARDAKATQNMLGNILRDTQQMVVFFHGTDIKTMLAKQKDAMGRKLAPGSQEYQNAYMGAVSQYMKMYLKGTGVDPKAIMEMSPYNEIKSQSYQMKIQPSQGIDFSSLGGR